MRPHLALAFAALLAGCAAGSGPRVAEPVRGQAGVAPAVALERAAASLSRLGFEVGPITPLSVHAVRRGGADEAWAKCGRVLIVYDQDPQVRRSWVAAQTRAAEATVGVAPAAGTGSIVAVDARFSATYLDWYRNTPFRRACPSTGVLEGKVLRDVARP